MFDKIRYSYHLTACEKIIDKYKYIDHYTYELDKRFVYHKRKLNKLITHKRRNKKVREL